MRSSKLSLLLGVAGGVIVLDQLAKSLIRFGLQPGDRVSVWGEHLTFTYLLNTGGALGLPMGGAGRVLFASIAASGLLLLVYWFMPAHNRPRLRAVAMMLGGGLGNLIDRFRDPPGVVDFIHVRAAGFSWPVFNLADLAVMVGACALVAAIWWDEHSLRTRTRAH